MPGRVNKMCFKHYLFNFQSISVQTHQSLLLIDFNFAKIWKHPSRPPLTDFACSTVSRLQVKTHLVRMGHSHILESSVGTLCVIRVNQTFTCILPLYFYNSPQREKLRGVRGGCGLESVWLSVYLLFFFFWTTEPHSHLQPNFVWWWIFMRCENLDCYF